MSVAHITPSVEELSTIAVNVPCLIHGCNRVFSNSSTRRLHLEKVHHQKNVSSSDGGGSELCRWYHCPQPGCRYHVDAAGGTARHFNKMTNIKQHWLKVHAARSILCPRCGRGFSCTALLTAHSRSCGLMLQCQQCPSTFTSVEALQSHCRRTKHVPEESTVRNVRGRLQSLTEETNNSSQQTTDGNINSTSYGQHINDDTSHSHGYYNAANSLRKCNTNSNSIYTQKLNNISKNWHDYLEGKTMPIDAHSSSNNEETIEEEISESEVDFHSRMFSNQTVQRGFSHSYTDFNNRSIVISPQTLSLEKPPKKTVFCSFRRPRAGCSNNITENSANDKSAINECSTTSCISTNLQTKGQCNSADYDNTSCHLQSPSDNPHTTQNIHNSEINSLYNCNHNGFKAECLNSNSNVNRLDPSTNSNSRCNRKINDSDTITIIGNNPRDYTDVCWNEDYNKTICRMKNGIMNGRTRFLKIDALTRGTNFLIKDICNSPINVMNIDALSKSTQMIKPSTSNDTSSTLKNNNSVNVKKKASYCNKTAMGAACSAMSSHPPHLLAAIALSELAASAIKQVVNAVTQTDDEHKGKHCCSSCHHNKGCTSTGHNYRTYGSKRRCTNRQSASNRRRSAETQTRLTHKDQKQCKRMGVVTRRGLHSFAKEKLKSSLAKKIASEKRCIELVETGCDEATCKRIHLSDKEIGSQRDDTESVTLDTVNIDMSTDLCVVEAFPPQPQLTTNLSTDQITRTLANGITISTTTDLFGNLENKFQSHSSSVDDFQLNTPDASIAGENYYVVEAYNNEAFSGYNDASSNTEPLSVDLSSHFVESVLQNCGTQTSPRTMVNVGIVTHHDSLFGELNLPSFLRKTCESAKVSASDSIAPITFVFTGLDSSNYEGNGNAVTSVNDPFIGDEVKSDRQNTLDAPNLGLVITVPQPSSDTCDISRNSAQEYFSLTQNNTDACEYQDIVAPTNDSQCQQLFTTPSVVATDNSYATSTTNLLLDDEFEDVVLQDRRLGDVSTADMNEFNSQIPCRNPTSSNYFTCATGKLTPSTETIASEFDLTAREVNSVVDDITFTNYPSLSDVSTDCGNIRSSSIETQTEHDVLLSVNVNNAGSSGIGAVCAENSGINSCRANQSAWCTIETQTCEDFSDIEQYLCSTIQTQTSPDQVRRELFPELSLADTQTQTGLEESPYLVHSHTQTSL